MVVGFEGLVPFSERGSLGVFYAKIGLSLYLSVVVVLSALG